jgi:hypothetical protein
MMLAMKGSSAPDEVEQARNLIHRLGGRGTAVEQYGADLAVAPTTLVKVLVPARSGRV